MSTWELGRAGIYLRVSSAEQRDRQTILTQREFAERYCELRGIRDLAFYADDGVSGTIPLRDRPAGSELYTAVRAGQLGAVLVYKLDRLARSTKLILEAVEGFEAANVQLISMTEPFDTSTPSGRLQLTLLSAVAGFERETFLERSGDGTDRAARLGRPLGGIVPYGYRVIGLKQDAVWAIDDQPIWGGKSPADIVRWIYELLALERRSCRWIAAEFNRLSIPTTDQRDARRRKTGTQLMWRPGRIRNLVVNPCYRGEYQYGRRTEKTRDVIKAIMPALVSEELWNAAQETLALHRIQATSGSRKGYLLRGVVRCGICGLTYCGANGQKGAYWYRCNGQLVERGPIAGKCIGKSIRGDEIERIVWTDVETWLREPGELLEELQADTEQTIRNVAAESEGTALETRLVELEAERKRAIALHVKGTLPEDELDQMLADVAKQRRAVEDRLAALSPVEEPAEPPISVDLLTELRRRLEVGLDFATRQEIVRILVRRALVHTTIGADGKKLARVVVEYRFPESGVVPTSRDTGSLRRPEGDRARPAGGSDRRRDQISM